MSEAQDIRISAIRPEFVDTLWPEVVRLLEPSVETSRGKYSIGDVREAVLSGELVLWLVWKDDRPVAFYTTRLIEYPNRRAMAMDWVGGNGIFSWMDAALSEMEAHARRNGCQHLEGFGRLAWGRLLKRRGWEPEYVAYRMELTDGQG
jgi:hypothetical protein